MKGHIERRQGGTRGAVLRAAALAVLAWAVLPGTSAAQTADAPVGGTVTNVTSDGPVAGLEVTLHLIRGDAEESTETATTDPEGRFRFEGVTPDPALSYVVTATHQDVDYASPRVASTEADSIVLLVYDATTATTDVSIASWTVWVDREGEGVAVQHDLELVNGGTTTYLGGQEVGPGEWAVIRLSLAPDASGFQYLGSFIECCAVVEPGSFVHTEPIRPGTSTATVRYSAPTPQGLTFPVFLPTTSFSLLVPADVTVEAPGLSETDRITDRGVEYVVYSASNLREGTALDVALSSVHGGGGAWAYVLVGGVLAIAAAGFLGALAIRRRSRGRRRPPAKTKGASAKAPARSNGKRAGAVVVAPRDAAATAEQIDLLVDEIAVLDVAFDRGLVDEDTHDRLRAAAKSRLAALSAGDGAGRPGEGP